MPRPGLPVGGEATILVKASQRLAASRSVSPKKWYAERHKCDRV